MMVDREAELRRFISFLEENHGGVVVVRGSRGMGKTTFLERAAEELNKCGYAVLRARGGASEYEPYYMWKEALRPIGRDHIFHLGAAKVLGGYIFHVKSGLVLCGMDVDDADLMSALSSAIMKFSGEAVGDTTRKRVIGGGRRKMVIYLGDHAGLGLIVEGDVNPHLDRIAFRTVSLMEERWAPVLEGWNGQMAEVQGMGVYLEDLVGRRIGILSREEIREALAEILDELAGNGGVAVIFDDVDRGDPESLALLEVIASSTPPRTVVLVSFTPEALRDRPEAKKTITSLIENGRPSTVIDLRPLEAEELGEVLGTAHPHRFGEEFIRWVRDLSGGNPGTALEVLRHLADEGIVRESPDGVWVESPAYRDIPPESLSVGELLRIKLADLGERERVVLAAMLALEEWDPSAIEEIAGVETRALMEALDRLGSVGFDERVFSDALLRDTLRSLLPETLLGMMHNRAARHFLSRGMRERAAYHYFMARSTEGVELLTEMAGAYERDGRTRHAAMYYRRAAELSERAGKNAESLYHRAASLFMQAGDYRSAVECFGRMKRVDSGAAMRYIVSLRRANDRAGMEELLERLRRGGAEDWVLNYAEGVYLFMKKKLPEALWYIKRAMETYPGDDPEVLTDMYNTLGTCLMSSGELREAEECLKTALRHSESLNDMLVVGGIYANLGALLRKMGRLSESVNMHLRAREIYEIQGATGRLANVLANLGVAYQNMGELRIAGYYYERAVDVYRRLGNRVYMALMLSNLSTVYLYLGKFEAALRYMEMAEDAFREEELIYGLGLVAGNRGEYHLYRGDLDTAAERFREAERLFSEAGVKEGVAYARIHLAWALASAGDLTGAAESIDLALDDLRDGGLSERALALFIKGLIEGEMKGDPETVLIEAKTCADEAGVRPVRAMASAALSWFRGDVNAARSAFIGAGEVMEMPYKTLTMVYSAAATGDADSMLAAARTVREYSISPLVIINEEVRHRLESALNALAGLGTG